MNYLKLFLIFALLQSCLTEPKSLCEDVTCNSWQYCHKVKANNKPEKLYCKVSAIKQSDEIYLSVRIEHNYCWNCEPAKPILKFSENNFQGCLSNDDCKTISKNYQ